MKTSELKDLPVEFQELPVESQKTVLQFINDDIRAVYNESISYNCEAELRERSLVIEDDDEYGGGDPVFQHYDCWHSQTVSGVRTFSCIEWKGEDMYDMIRHVMWHLGLIGGDTA